MKHVVILATSLAGLALPGLVTAQTLGTFHWRLSPYCNTLTLTVIQEGNVFRLQGYEDLCDSIYLPQPVSGTAVLDSGGGVMIGLTTSRPGGFSFKGTRIVVQLDISTLDGGWSDDAGRTGRFRRVTSPRQSLGTQRGDQPLAFVHVVSAENRRAGSADNVSCFSHSLADANATALISVTHNRGPLSAIRPVVVSPVSLYLHSGPTGLDGALAQDVWCISRNDSLTLPIGAGFTVQILSP